MFSLLWVWNMSAARKLSGFVNGLWLVLLGLSLTSIHHLLSFVLQNAIKTRGVHPLSGPGGSRRKPQRLSGSGLRLCRGKVSLYLFIQYLMLSVDSLAAFVFSGADRLTKRWTTHRFSARRWMTSSVPDAESSSEETFPASSKRCCMCLIRHTKPHTEI